MFLKVSPQAIATFGRKVLYGGELTATPPEIYRLDCEFDAWPEDSIQEINCIYIMTDELSEELKKLNPRVTGVSFDNVTVHGTLRLKKENIGKQLPEYKWMRVYGKPAIDDFGLSDDFRLVISERVLQIIKPKLPHATTSVFIKSEPQKK